MEKALQIKRFNRWTVLSQDGSSRYMFCKCDCGTKKRIRVDSLIVGESTSCGCYAKEKVSERMSTRGGATSHRLHGVYYDAYRRCFNSRRKDYKHYGGRGITMCERWSDYEEGFDNFLQDMLPTWKEGLELERMDCNGDYEPSNCSWVTRKQQTNNLRTNLRLSYKTMTLTASEWGGLLDINPKLLTDRVGKLKWTDEKALEYVKDTQVVYLLEGSSYRTKSDLVKSIHPKVTNATHFINKYGGFEELCLTFGVIVSVLHEQRSLKEAIKYLTNQEYAPVWETEDLLYIKNKYKYYDKED